MFTMKVIGAQDIARRLTAMRAAGTAGLDAAVRAGAETIRTAAVAQAPVRTGTLRRSITTNRSS